MSTRAVFRKLGYFFGTLLAVTLSSVAVYVWTQASAFDASVRHPAPVPMPEVAASTGPEAVARGKQLGESVGACSTTSCHGASLAGGRTLRLGPAATLTAPNITGARLAAYSDRELARLLRFGVKKDGTSVVFMPVQNFAWLSDADLSAMIAWLRSVPAVERADGARSVTIVGKVLDRRGAPILDVARHIAETPRDAAPDPAPNAAYGRFVARACTMCHGEHLSGGAIPGAPPGMPVPLNLTPDASGLRDWTYDDFERLLTTGVRRNGARLDPFMSYEAFAKYDDTQKHALFAYLQSLPPTALGGR